jgi:hypothetical protein
MADAQTIARANVKLIPKFDGLEKSISQQIDGANLGGAGKGVGSKIGANLAEGIKSAAKGLNLGDTFDNLSPALGGVKEAAGGVIDVFGGIGTAAAAGAAAAGAAFAGLAVDVGKQAFDAFASFEQLEGGVETLFKGSSDTVMQNAQNAFKTAGISANDYMENVTSFSASLISALSGDTEEAAKVADRAIVDMSDNANKMGSSMESIQNAYQGFAKQNYTIELMSAA